MLFLEKSSNTNCIMCVKITHILHKLWQILKKDAKTRKQCVDIVLDIKRSYCSNHCDVKSLLRQNSNHYKQILQ